MKIETRNEGDVYIMELHGKLAQPDGTATLRKKVKELSADGKHELVLDLRNVPWLDSSGVGEIVAGFTLAQDNGGALKLVLPEKPLSGFSFTQLELVIETFEDPGTAVASFGH
jgi:anti-sigma B factor antagonist